MPNYILNNYIVVFDPFLIKHNRLHLL